MFSELKFVDSVEQKCKVTTKFPCETSEDNFTSITTDKGTLICRLHSPKNNGLFSITYSKQFIETSTFILSQHLDINVDKLIPWLEQFDLYECVLRTDTSASIDNCVKKRFRSTSAKWSPRNLVGTKSLITILNDTGSLDLYLRIVRFTGIIEYVHLHNVTMKGIEQYKNEWNPVDEANATVKYIELKQRLCKHTTSAFLWTHLITHLDKNFAILIVAYADGRITFWKCNSVPEMGYKTTEIEYFQDYTTDLLNISCLHWIQSACGGLLIIGTETGKLVALPVTNIQMNSLEISKQIVLHKQDDIKVEHIISSLYNNKLYIYVVKHSYILIYVLNDAGIILDQTTFCVGNLNIIDCYNCGENIILVLTHTGVCKELKVRCENYKISIQWKHVYVNINWTLKKACGVFASKNNLIVSFLTDACRTIDLKDERENFHLTTFVNKFQDPVDILLNNKSNSLYNYYDCLEMIRVTGYQNKEIVYAELLSNINYNDMNLIQLKTYLHLVKISEQIYDQVESIGGYNFKSSSEIQLLIEIKLAVYYIQLILDECKVGARMTKFIETCLLELISFLKEIVVQDLPVKLHFGQNIIDEILDVMLRTKDMDLPKLPDCYICGNHLFGTSCMNRHFDNRCAISMIQITQSKYKCPLCARCIREEAIVHFNAFCCPICDFPLDILHRKEINLEEDNRCREDCLK